MEAPPEEKPMPTLLDVDDSVPVEEPQGEAVSTGELFRFAKGFDLFLLILGIVGALVTGTTLPVFSIIFGGMVEEAATAPENEVGEKVASYAKWMAVAGAGSFVAAFLMAACFSVSGERQIDRIRREYFSAILRQEPAWFDIQKTGTLTTRLHGDVKVIHTGIADKASFFFLHLSTIISSYTIGLIFCWRLGLVLLGVAPILGIAGMCMYIAISSLTNQNRSAYAKAGAVAEEVLAAIKTVHSLSSHRNHIESFDQEIDASLPSSSRLGFATGASTGFAIMVMFGSYCIGLYYASFLVQRGHHGIQDILTAFFSVLFGSFSLGQIIPPVAAFTAARAAAYKIFRVVDRKPRIHPGKTRLPDLQGAISFQKLTFRYPSRMQFPVVKDLCLDIEAGTTVALVGLSGCGKSSIVSMVQRFYEPADGYFSTVQLDGTLKAFPYESNLTLLDFMAAGKGSTMKRLTMPISDCGEIIKEVEINMSSEPACNDGMTCSVPNTDGAIRHEGDQWFWVEDAKTEFKLPSRICSILNGSLKSNDQVVEVDLGFGRYEMNVKDMSRKNVRVGVRYESNGHITVDGVPLNDVDIEWWRDQIGTVTQEPVLFSGTVTENIRMGRPDATMDEVKEACRKAYIHHVIERWPEGYETAVGEGGSQLSGGQKQRIAIARAIIKRPRLLILDEATSALDRESEMKVQQALDKLFKSGISDSTTTIVIAHRLQTIMHADKIVVMKPPARGQEHQGGSIVEMGTHDELLKSEGHYKMLWESQNRTTGGPARGVEVRDDTSSEAEDELPLERNKSSAELEEEQRLINEKKKEGSLGRVAALSAPWCPVFVPAIIGVLMNGAVYPVYAYVFAKALNVLSGLTPGNVNSTSVTSRSDMDEYVWYFLAIAIGGFIANVLQFGALGYIGAQMTCKLRKMLFSHMLRQDMSFFDQPSHESGALAAVLSGHTESVHTLFGSNLGILLRVLACLGFGFGIAFSENAELTAVILATVPCLALSGIINTKLMGASFGADLSTLGRVTSEAISNNKVVASFNLRRQMVTAFTEAGKNELSVKSKRAVGTGLTYGFSQFALFGTFGLALWYGARLIEKGDADFESVMIVVMEVTMAAMGTGEAMGIQSTGMDASDAAAEVFAILDRVPEVDQMSVVGEENVLTKGEIVFDSISFAYPTRPNIQVLTNFDLTVHSPEEGGGMKVGLIGGTGSGKSTTLQLLQRLYSLEQRKNSGRITVDGVDLASINLKWWRQQVGVVSQEPALFSASVAENIRMGKPEATMKEIEEAARLAHIHDDVMKLPEGYDTNVGMKGSMLSGGQKQRVAIARAIVKQPRFLLLDEATSALDNTSEKEVQKALDNVIASRHMTTITIAHKLTTIQDANAITVLDKGQIIEQGTHEELMAIEGGDYRTRFNLYHSLQDS